MDTTKIDKDTIELTSKQTIFREDILSEKETLEARLLVLKDMLDTLDKE